MFSNRTVKVHLGLFGDVLINESKEVNRSFYLAFAKGEINGYVVKAIKLGKPLDEIYHWRTDLLSPHFNKAWIKKLLKKQGAKNIDNVLMNQAIFTGVSNKIRNEALYLAAIHPLSITGKITAAKITKLINEVVNYARIFYKQLQNGGINDHFQVCQQKHAADGS